MKKNTRHALLLAALVLPATATISLAQYRIDNGSARDANNRIGSGGFNSTAQLNGRINGLAGNYIVTGNITGGRAFRGSLGYTDTTSFRGSLGSASFDNFMRDSIGTSQMRGTSMGNNNFATIQPYFGAGATVAAPQGFARDPSTGQFYLPSSAPGVTAGDGRVDFGGASRADLSQGILSAQRATGGAGLTTSPFASMNQRDQLTNLTRMSDFTAIAKPGQDNVTAFVASDVISSGPRLPQAGTPAPTDAGSTKTDPMKMGNDDGKSESDKSPALTGQGATYRNLRAIDNNSQYAELRKRMDERSKLPKLPGSEATESLNKVNADILAARAKEKDAKAKDDSKTDDEKAKTQSRGPGAGGANAPTGVGPGAATPGADAKPADESRPVAPAPEDNLNLPRPKTEAPTVTSSMPLEISSLAVGVKDKNLGKLLTDAETAMKDGKFSTAIEAYDRAEEIASDDPLVFMGRSIAELGGGYYRSAELHLRQAFAADRALLLARFDLRSMLTDGRLNDLQADLAQIAKKNDKDTGPLLLLAFLYYNTGFPERSERALEMVQERAGGKDAGAQLLQDAWFAKAPAAEPMNK